MTDPIKTTARGLQWSIGIYLWEYAPVIIRVIPRKNKLGL